MAALPQSASVMRPESLPPWLPICDHHKCQRHAQQILEELFSTLNNGGDAISIYSTLEQISQKCIPSQNNWKALEPSSEVNTVFDRLVSILRGSQLSYEDQGFRSAVDYVVSRKIDNSIALSHQSSFIRTIASQAETEMEYFYAGKWLNHLAHSQGAKTEDSIFAGLKDFPYFDSYEDLVRSELGILPNIKRAIVGGAGPLPITGFLIASLRNIEVMLVDSDERAAHSATLLVNALENSGVLPKDQVTVVHTDICSIDVNSPNDDVILVASLVHSAAKIRLAQRIAQQSEYRPYLLMRSAMGLTSRLAYSEIPRKTILDAGWLPQGELVTDNHIVPSVQPSIAKQFGLRSDLEPKLIGVMPSHVLNTSELFTLRD